MGVTLWDGAPTAAALPPRDQFEPAMPEDSRAVVLDAYEQTDATAGCCDMEGMT